ncbi:MAG: hypothetical protein K5897_09900 [Eubacterium sp.]|nr:hypothetical protein [Eubacterium sp.]
MHCQTCGAEIGDRKVCPFCDTPIRNVLVAGYQPAYEPPGEGAVGDTTVIRQESAAAATPVRKKNPTLTESLTAAAAFPAAEKKVWGSVIPDYIDDPKHGSKAGSKSSSDHKKRKKRKWIILTAALLGVLLIATATVFFVLNKKKKTYIEGLKDVSVTFKESTDSDSDPGEKNRSLYQSMLSGTDTADFFVSTSGEYAAYETEDTRTDWVEDHSEAGGHEKTVYIFELHLLSKNRERLDLCRFEKEQGRIDLLGVTDQGALIFNDTEEGRSFELTDNGESRDLGGLMKMGVFYESGEAVFLTENGDLFGKTDDAIRQLSSDVSDVYYLDGGKYYGYLKPVEKITSTASSLRWLVYTSAGSWYRKNLTDPRVGGEPWEGTPAQDPETVLYDAEMKEVKLPEQDLRGDGSFSFEEGELIFRGGGLSRNLGKADQVVCLAGDLIYVMRSGKLLEINVFTKEEKEIADHGMIPVVSETAGSDS